MRFEIPENEYMYQGHNSCPGCGMPILMRHVTKILGERSIIVVVAGCVGGILGRFPYATLKIPHLAMAFAGGAAAAAGIRAGLDRKGIKDVTVFTWAGDGGTFDIGLQGLSGSAERNDDVLYICYDNEAYMNTGVQRSSATPWGSWTTTTPSGGFKDVRKKNIMEIMAAHRIPYAATVSIAYVEDLVKKIKTAKELRGFRFIHAYSSCPTGWKMLPENSIHVARLAVETRTFPLYEVQDGLIYRMTVTPKRKPVTDYLGLQGRFQHLNLAQMDAIQAEVDQNWQILQDKCRSGLNGVQDGESL
jgi:pyruvate/2-oxoacid:ferredoxin oxidoreductase beta subunit